MIIGVYGKTGAGKSHYIKNELIPNIDKNFIVYDVMGEYKQIIHKFKKKPVFYKPLEFTIEELEMFLETVYDYSNVIVLIEELDTIALSKTTKILSKFLNTCRHRGIDLIYTAKRLAYIPQVFIANTTYYIIFSVSNTYDINKFNSLGVDREILINLGEHEKILYRM